MKQTRLSFLSKDNTGTSNDGLRKRKLSSPESVENRSVKVVRRENEPQPESDDPVVVLDDDQDQQSRTDKEDVPEDVEMVEIISMEDSNSVAPSSLADTSLIEEVIDDNPEDADSSPHEVNSSSEDTPADKSGIANLLLPPTTMSNGLPMSPAELGTLMKRDLPEPGQEPVRPAKKEKLTEAQRQEREAQKAERRASIQREKEEKMAKAKEARQREKELRQAEKEAARQKEKELRQAEKDAKEQKRQQELNQKMEAKMEEKRQREEEKRQREEEKRQKEEEKRLKEEEEENKKKRASQAFTKFFKVAAKSAGAEDEGSTGGPQAAVGDVVEVVNPYFMPFAVKGDMKLAPCVRRVLTKADKSALEMVLAGEGDKAENNYIKSIKTKTHVPLKGTRTWIVTDSSDDDSEDDLLVVGELIIEKCVFVFVKMLTLIMDSFQMKPLPTKWRRSNRRSKSIGPST